MRKAHPQNLLHDQRRKLQVDSGARQIHKMAAQHPDQVVNPKYQQQSAGEHPQRFDRVVWNDAVIHIHGKYRHRQREHID
jgi:hypothetical protein